MDTDTKPTRGRPNTFTDDLAEEICERIGKGETLASICSDEHMPAVRTVSGWKEHSPKFTADFARAREEGFDAIAAECLKIADDEKHDWKMSQKGAITNEVAISRARLQVDARLKLLAKWDPKRYGEKIDVNAVHSGEIRIVVGGDI